MGSRPVDLLRLCRSCAHDKVAGRSALILVLLQILLGIIAEHWNFVFFAGLGFHHQKDAAQKIYSSGKSPSDSADHGGQHVKEGNPAKSAGQEQVGSPGTELEFAL